MAPDPADVRTSYREVFAVAEFRVVFLAHVLSMLGSVVTTVALSVLVFQRSGSPLLTALVFAFAFLPHAVGGAVLSALADLVPPRRLLVGCDLARAGLVLLMALPGTPVPALLALVVAVGTLGPLFNGARAASLADILSGGRWVLGRSLIGMVSMAGQVVGYALGGALLLVVQPRTALLLEALTFLLSAALLRVGTRPRPAAAPGDTRPVALARQSLATVGSVARDRPLRRLLLLGWLPPAFAVAPEALAVPYATVLGGGATAAAVLLSAPAAGAVVGDLLVGRLLTPSQRERSVLPLAAWLPVPLLATALDPGFVPLVALLAASGLGYGYTLGQSQRVLEAVGPQRRGRVGTVNGAGMMVTQGLGFAAAGAVGEVLPPHLVVAGAAAAGLVVTLAVGRGATGPLPSAAPRRGRHASSPRSTPAPEPTRSEGPTR